MAKQTARPARKIVHVDMDAFYASVEQRDNPDYRRQPLVVGGEPNSRGVVAACSYEARRFGIHSAMPCAQAYRLCPQAIFVRPRFDAYKAVSRQIHEVFQQFTAQVEPLSLDEAYLDLSDCSLFAGSATLIAQEIKRRIQARTGLTASAGVSYNKFLAKIASDVNKPDGLFVIRPEQGEAYVATLPVGRIHGVGKVTEARMHALGINTGADLKSWSLPALEAEFGKAAHYYFQIARGRDHRPVETDRIRKSIGAENTFARDLSDPALMLEQLQLLAEKVATILQRSRLCARCLTVKVKYADFRLVTRSQTCRRSFAEAAEILPLIAELLSRTDAGAQPVRLLGVSVSELTPALAENMVQLELPVYLGEHRGGD